MGSLTQLMPGEQQGCIGCHEPRAFAPPSAGAIPCAFHHPPVAIEPPTWGVGPIDFVVHVQPVLDKHCASCHSGVDPAVGIDLSGDKTRLFNMELGRRRQIPL